MSDGFPGNIVKKNQRRAGVCACGRGEKRKGQGNCHRCHAEANQVYRARLKSELEDLRAAKWRAFFAAKASETPSIEGVSGQQKSNEKTEAGDPQ